MRLVLSDNMDGKGPISYSGIDKIAEFPGGPPALAVFLTEHIRYPFVAKENGTQGRVIVSFIANTDGTLDDIKVSRGIGDGCDEEALRAVKLMPRWISGTMSGKPVRIPCSLPINFGLTEKAK